jgi:prepilin-type processing-associated H-X9-DG protein
VDGPNGTGPGPNQGYLPNFDWSQVNGSITASGPAAGNASTGVIFRASQLSMAAIKDGASYTYLIGERYLNIDCYNVGTCCDNDQGWDQGYDWDTDRWTANPPSQDRAGVGGCADYFGAAHPAGFHMAFCDGSVAKINYNVDPTFHQQLGNRADGEPTQLQGLSIIK